MRKLDHTDLDYILHKFDQGMQEWRPKRLSETTRKTYLFTIRQFHTFLEGVGTDLLGYARVDVQAYMDYLKKEKKQASTINKTFAAVVAFSKWMERPEVAEGIDIVKMEQVRKKAPKALDKLEKQALLRNVQNSGNKRNLAIVRMLLDTGVRVGELTSLDREDVEMSERKGYVRILGKGNKERILPLNTNVRKDLLKYLETRNDEMKPLFLSERKQRISIRSVQTMLQKYGVHPHALRHTFATELVREGEDLAKVQALTGHASADMVLRYSQPTLEDLEKAVDRLL